MNFNESLWQIHIPHRKIAYCFIYIGLILAMLPILPMPSGILTACLGTGIGLILLSSFYLAYKLFNAGFRRHAILVFATITIACGLSISCLIVYRNQILKDRYESDDIELNYQNHYCSIEIISPTSFKAG